MRKVKAAELHDVVQIAGIGQLPRTLPPSTKTITNLEMYRLDCGGLLIRWGTNKNNLSEYIVNAATVKGTYLTPEVAHASVTASTEAEVPAYVAPVVEPKPTAMAKGQVKLTPNGPKHVGAEPFKSEKTDAEKAGQTFKPKAPSA